MVPEIDVAGRRIVVNPPEGLLEVNAPSNGGRGLQPATSNDDD
jgi:hypothetical protein